MITPLLFLSLAASPSPRGSRAGVRTNGAEQPPAEARRGPRSRKKDLAIARLQSDPYLNLAISGALARSPRERQSLLESEGLASGQLGSAGLDVFPEEPKINPELLKNDQVTCLPHMGTETMEVRLAMERTVLNNITTFFDSGKVHNIIPEQKDWIGKL